MFMFSSWDGSNWLFGGPWVWNTHVYLSSHDDNRSPHCRNLPWTGGTTSSTIAFLYKSRQFPNLVIDWTKHIQIHTDPHVLKWWKGNHHVPNKICPWSGEFLWGFPASVQWTVYPMVCPMFIPFVSLKVMWQWCAHLIWSEIKKKSWNRGTPSSHPFSWDFPP